MYQEITNEKDKFRLYELNNDNDNNNDENYVYDIEFEIIEKILLLKERGIYE